MIKNVTVMGGGVLGTQIAFQAAYSGFNVTIWLRSEGSIERTKPKLEMVKNSYIDAIKLMDTNEGKSYENWCFGIADYEDFDKDECLKKVEEAYKSIKLELDIEKAVSDSDLVIDNICEIANTYKDLSYKNFQVLAPIYKTVNGIDNINLKLQNIFNKKAKNKNEIKVGEVTYRETDKVIQLTNQPDDNVFNGDIGQIYKITNKGNRELYIDFDGNLVKYTPSNFNNFKLAYSISIHKSQGSEFDVVVIPIVQTYNKMLYRKLIYTAVTRSKKKLYLIGNYKALCLAINNNNVDIRNTTIANFLKNGINNK